MRLKSIIKRLKKKYYNMRGMREPQKYGFLSPSAFLSFQATVFGSENLYMYENTNIYAGSMIMNPRSKFIMKKNSFASYNLTVVPGNHMSLPGWWKKDVTDAVKDRLDMRKTQDQDIIVEEDVWIGINVTLLNGAHIGRGCIVGSGAVVRGNIPPYAIVVGNPAKITGFVFKPEEVIEHEKKLYPEEERLSLESLEKNYDKYFSKRLKEIRNFTSL